MRPLSSHFFEIIYISIHATILYFSFFSDECQCYMLMLIPIDSYEKVKNDSLERVRS